MELNNHHPLGAITNRGNLSMLEALIPFVEYPLKLPLALFIKFTEIRMIIGAFQSLDNLSRLGLHNISNSPMDMLCSLTGIPADTLNMLFSMMENSGSSLSPDFLSGLMGNTPNPPFSPSFNPPPPDNDFNQKLQNIFAEYDMLQAAEYAEKTQPADMFPEKNRPDENYSDENCPDKNYPDENCPDENCLDEIPAKESGADRAAARQHDNA